MFHVKYMVYSSNSSLSLIFLYELNYAGHENECRSTLIKFPVVNLDHGLGEYEHCIWLAFPTS